jgi:hypothetical protein
MNILIIGKGSVGRTLAQFHADDTLQYHDPAQNEYAIAPSSYDVGHITYPMTDLMSWVETTQRYLESYSKVKWWMIHSTIVPEALEYLPKHFPIVYSPIRATEAIMDSMVAEYRKFWAFVHKFAWPENQVNNFITFIESHFPNPLQFTNAKSLALGKLLETADFGMQIAFAQMVHYLTKKDFTEAYRIYRRYSEYGADYTQLTEEGAPKEWIPRGLFRPDVIKGKCVMQNLKLLHDAKIGDRELWQWIIDNNERTKRRQLNE